MATPILPFASHSQRPSAVTGLPVSTIDAAVESVKSQPTLTDTDFESIASALRDPKKATKASAWLASNNVSEQERTAFADYLNNQNAGARAAGLDPASRRSDSDIANIGGHGVSPEDVLAGGMAAKGIVGAVKAAPTGRGMLAAGAEMVAQATPVVKYETTKHLLTAAGIPQAVALPIAMAVSGYSGKGGAKGAGKAPAAEPTLSEQLGVSPASTGATMEGMPDISQVDRRITGAPFENLPDKVTMAKVSPKPRTPSNFEDIARSLGLDPTKMEPIESIRGIPVAGAESTLSPDTLIGAAKPTVGKVQTEGLMKGAPIVSMPSEARMTELTGIPGDLTPPPGLSPAERNVWLREELAKELMSREGWRDMGMGSRKRGAGFTTPKD